jgi:hypothetical protein
VKLRLVSVAATLALLGAACAPEDRPAEPRPGPTLPPTPPLTALYRFWDTNLGEHLYTYGLGEPVDLRNDPAFGGEVVVGYVSTGPRVGAIPLTRARCRDGRHLFYFHKPYAKADIARVEDFEVYVWTVPGEGLVPVHASFLPDGKDAYFSQDLAAVRETVARTLATTGQVRRLVERMFHVSPTPVQPDW